MLEKFNKYIIYLIVIFSVMGIYSFAPHNNYFLIFASYIVLFYSFYIAKDIKTAFNYGFIFAIVHFTVGLYWMFSIMVGFDSIDKIIIFIIISGIIFLTAFFFGLLGLVSNLFKLKEKHFTFWITIFLPSLATFLEYLRSFLFTGLPWYSPSDAIIDIGFSVFLPLGGVLLINFIFFTLIGIFIHLCIRKNNSLVYLISLIVFLIVLMLISKNISFTKPLNKQTLNVHIISANFTKKDKESRYKTIDRINDFTSLTLLEPRPTLSIWPESVINSNYSEVIQHVSNSIKKLSDSNITVLTGAYVKRQNKTINTVFSLSEEEILYSKQHLLPFGEYTPSWVEKFKYFIPEVYMNNLNKDENFNKIINVNGLKISPSICFEILFPNELRKKNNESNMLVHISDLGWFEQGWAQSYLLQLARMRAIESQKPIVYVVNKGLSAFIDKNGIVMKISRPNLQESLYHTVIPQEGNTLYTKYGNKMILLYFLGILLLFLLNKRYLKNKN